MILDCFVICLNVRIRYSRDIQCMHQSAGRSAVDGYARIKPLLHYAGNLLATVRRCGGLSMVFLQLKDPLELFVKSREFLPGSGFLSRRDMT